MKENAVVAFPVVSNRHFLWSSFAHKHAELRCKKLLHVGIVMPDWHGAYH